jgi:hypothetical protein
MGAQEKTFAELRKIAANQQEQINQDNKLIAQRNENLNQRERELSIYRDQINMEHQANARRIADQSFDFAIKTLPWWKRWNLSLVMARAREIEILIQDETNRLIRLKAPKVEEKPNVVTHESDLVLGQRQEVEQQPPVVEETTNDTPRQRIPEEATL